jgi:hypothetical protein
MTAEGSTIDFTQFNNGFGVVNLKGNPNVQFQSCAATIVQRKKNAPNRAPTPIQIVFLSLTDTTGTTGVQNSNGFHYKIYLTLDPFQLPNSIGIFSVVTRVGQQGGTFNEKLIAYFQATFTAVDGGPSITPVKASMNLEAKDVTWVPELRERNILLSLMRFGEYPDQDANFHLVPYPKGAEDFFIPNIYVLKADSASLKLEAAGQQCIILP